MYKLESTTLFLGACLGLFFMSFPSWARDSKGDPFSSPEQLRSWESVLRQAEAVEREIWWVITGERSYKYGSFEKLRSFWASKEKTKLRSKDSRSLLSCNSFDFNILEIGRSGELIEKCSKKNQVLLRVEIMSSRSMEVLNFVGPQRDVYGLGPSLVHKSSLCKLTWDKNSRLTTMTCTNYQREKSPELLVSLKEMLYAKKEDPMIRLKGTWLKSLLPHRSLEALVPQQGKILVTETELEKPKKNEPKIVEALVRGERKNLILSEDQSLEREARKVNKDLQNFRPPEEIEEEVFGTKDRPRPEVVPKPIPKPKASGLRPGPSPDVGRDFSDQSYESESNNLHPEEAPLEERLQPAEGRGADPDLIESP